MSLDAWLFWGFLAAWNVSLTLALIGHGHPVLLRAHRPGHRPALLVVRDRGQRSNGQ